MSMVWEAAGFTTVPATATNPSANADLRLSALIEVLHGCLSATTEQPVFAGAPLGTDWVHAIRISPSLQAWKEIAPGVCVNTVALYFALRVPFNTGKPPR